MANKDDYLTSYREFFEFFAQTVNPNDQLPVKLGSYKLLNVEVVGGIIDWTTQYLSQKKCPPHLFSPLIKIIIEEIRKSCKKQPFSYGFSSTDNAYEPLKLMQAVMAKTNDVCLRYLDNSMLCSLPAPSNTYYETSIYAVRNRRRQMEDRHVAIHDLNAMFNIQEASPSNYYAIFDGHAGHDAAVYSAAHLHQFLAENKYFISNPEQALLDAFCKTDAFFLEKCKIESLSGGTTAVVALLRPKENALYIAWVGDSQALLVNQGKVLQCVNPHKPCREDERERIEKAGGCVMLWGTWRVNGQLAVSRAIGDADYKPHVIAIPDVREISLDGGEDFLIVACDGLWDFLSEDAAAQEVYYMIAENADDTERVSKHLVQLARYRGSTDNISVIVVFLREPHQIAAEAHRWATRKGPSLTTNNMETGLDNANNPFNNSNGSLKNLEADTDNINLQKSSDGLLLNLTDNFKANGTNLSKDIFVSDKSNGTNKSASAVHFDEDFGPETDVDAVDEAFSPQEKEQAFSETLSKGLIDSNVPNSFNDELKEFAQGLVNNNPLDDGLNPFLNSQNKEHTTQVSRGIGFEEFQGTNRDETPTPPAETVHDVGGLEVNPTESDSEDEWNYIKGDQAQPANLSSQPETVVETSELDDAMSQLNPNAAEFVPVSPTRSIPSPACRALINDEVISESPKRPVRVDINVPSETEFESEVKSRPSDFGSKNGLDSDNEHNASGVENIENILNGKSLDEIPEFHPGNTPPKLPVEEFHFGPNAAPFTPRVLDQSEAFSTKANYGDDTEQTLNTSFNDSDLAVPNKEQTDPMSTSFSAERGDSNPFQDKEDLNKVHELPENLDAFLQDCASSDKENTNFDETISDLPEHFPLDNDQAAIQTTDLDKISQDDEKELASPLECHDDLLDVMPHTNVPPNDLSLNTLDSNLLGHFVIHEKPLSHDSDIATLPELELINATNSPEPAALSPQPTLNPFALEEEICRSTTSPAPLDTSSPIQDGVDDLLQPQSPLPGKTDSVNVEISRSPVCERPTTNYGFEELEFNPKSQVENINLETKDDSFVVEALTVSPIPACEYSSEPRSCEFSPHLIPGSQSPDYLLPEQKQDEEVTSSVKDDVSRSTGPLSPVKTPEMLDEESVNPVNLALQSIETPQFRQDVVRSEVQSHEISSQDTLSDLSCPRPISQPLEPQLEGYAINTLEPSAPIEPIESCLFNGLNAFTSDVNEQIFIKTDNIIPEFAEPTVLTPSEESRGNDDVVPSSHAATISEKLVESLFSPTEPVLPQLEPSIPHKEELKPAQTVAETPKEIPALAPLPIIPVVSTKVSEVKAEEKRSPAPAAGKKPIGKVEPRKSTTPKLGTSRAASKPIANAPKPAGPPKVPSKTGTAKAPGIVAKTSSTTASKPLLKPKTATGPKTIDKKPLASVDVKASSRTAPAKKPTETLATRTTTRPATATAKLSPTKTLAPRPTTAPRTLAPKTATSTIPPKPPAAAKPRVPLTHRTTATTAVSKTATTTSAKPTTNRTVSAPRTTTAPRTITSTAPKPRVPLTKTVTKSADVEKEKKESANKLTASRTTTVTKTTSGTVTSRTTTLKKTEIKPLSDRTAASKTTTSSTRTTATSRKPGDIKTSLKANTTKVEKPKQNGVAPISTTEEIKEITIVNNVVKGSESENLVKDNSPLDNKLIIETSNTLIDMNPAD